MTLSDRGSRGNSIGSVDRALTRIVTGFHRSVLRASRFRLMSLMRGNHVLTMTTWGRRTGAPRTHPVIGIPNGERWYVVGSNGGAADHPSWARNLLANPVALIRSGTGVSRFRAELIAGPERDEVWRQLRSAYPTTESLQRKTDRQLPIFLLTPNIESEEKGD